MNINSKIFVAGHRGMVGSAIVRHLQKDGFANIITATSDILDLRNQQQTNQFFATNKPEYVFLAAAKVGGIHANNTYRGEFLYDNVLIATNTIEASRLNGVKKLINLGSSCIYPKLATQPLREESLLTGALESTNEPYAIAKIAAVKMCRYYNEQYGTDYLSLMPTNLYGPNDNYNLETSHVLPALIRKFVLAKLLRERNVQDVRGNLEKHPLGFGLKGEKDISDVQIIETLSGLGVKRYGVTLWGSGTVYREFLHADDIADAAVYFMQNISAHDAGEIVNIGTGIDCTIRELAEKIAGIVGFDGSIVFDATQPDGTPRKRLDVSKATSLGWSAKIGLDAGLKAVIGEYIA